MKLADLDMETRRLVVAAHIVAKRPKESALAMLRSAVEAFDAKHEQERAENVLNAIFGEIPTTPEAVLEAERELEANPVDIPIRLKRPPFHLLPQQCSRDKGHDGPCNGWPCRDFGMPLPTPPEQQSDKP